MALLLEIGAALVVIFHAGFREGAGTDKKNRQNQGKPPDDLSFSAHLSILLPAKRVLSKCVPYRNIIPEDLIMVKEILQKRNIFPYTRK